MRRIFAIALGLGLVWGSAARAQEAEPSEAEKPDAPSKVPDTTPLGEYGGVNPDAESAPPATIKPSKHPRVYWIGYRANESGGGRLFVQADRDLTVSQAVDDGKLRIHLGDVKVANRNTMRRLETRFFDGHVTVIEPQMGGKRGKKHKAPRGLSLVVSFDKVENLKEGAFTQNKGKDGLSYLYFDFPSAK
jgi:hypothetical protein